MLHTQAVANSSLLHSQWQLVVSDYWKQHFWTQETLHCVCMCMCVRVLSHVRLFVTPWTVALQAPLSMRILCHFLLRGILPTQGSNSRLCVSCIGRRVLYHCATWEALLRAWSFWPCPVCSHHGGLGTDFPNCLVTWAQGALGRASQIIIYIPCVNANSNTQTHGYLVKMRPSVVILVGGKAGWKPEPLKSMTSRKPRWFSKTSYILK